MDIKTYLQRINYSGPISNTLEVLHALQKAHLLQVPFENLDIHEKVPIQLDTALFFNKIVKNRRGGFCYELNGLFGELLRNIGFSVDYISARVYFREEYCPEFDHLALLVHIDGQTYLSDVGFGEFISAPLRFQLDTLQEDAQGTFTIESFDAPYLKVSKLVDRQKVPQYLFDPQARELPEFAGRCGFHQQSPASHFTEQRMISQQTEQGRITLSERQLKISTGEEVIETPVKDHSDFQALLLKYFQIVLVLLMVLLPQVSFSQDSSPVFIEENKKGTLYFYWGYNRSVFSKTNLHFSGPNYDFTLYDLKAADRPTKFGWVYFNPGTFTIPQYNFRFGYFLKDRWVLSGGMDHMKYIVTQNQETTISGVINDAASEKYAGAYLNQAITLDTDLLTFEHTNGFNFLSLDVEYLLPLQGKKNRSFHWSWNFGIGGVWIVTKTDVRVLEDGLDNDFHIAGYALGGKMGPRLGYKKRFFLSGEIKGGYATLPSVLIKNAEPELGDHNLSFFEYYLVGGIYF